MSLPHVDGGPELPGAQWELWRVLSTVPEDGTDADSRCHGDRLFLEVALHTCFLWVNRCVAFKKCLL